jgi:hypothetical protein
MSLKAFHVIFITAASIMLFGFGTWMLRVYRGPDSAPGDLGWAVGAFISAATLLVYEGFFLKKLKNISYL